MRFKYIAVAAAALLLTACSTQGVSSDAQTAAKSAKASTSGASKTRFKPYEVIDQKQGGIVVSRLSVPEDWKATSRVDWNYSNFYTPVHVSGRLEAPDGGSWIEFYAAETFLWLDRMHDRAPIGPGALGGIHHPNIGLPEAMARYVIAPNRRGMQNLKILGYRPVNDLQKAFPHVFDPNQAIEGEGICMRVSYTMNGAPVDEEFYGFMTKLETIPSGNMAEYHRRILMLHSMGAKSGKLESVRPLLGFVATSIEPNPGWQQRFLQVKKMQIDYYQRMQAQNYAQIAAAGAKSRALTEQSNQFLAQIDRNLAAQRNVPTSSYSSSDNADFYKRADDFDQNIRGTEHMKDQYGQVSDQYTDYNYHWTDGFGRFVHSDDPNFDPNKYLNGNYQQMTPADQ